MTVRRVLAATAAALIASCSLFAGCSTTGSNRLTCSSTEVAPDGQPGSSNAQEALDWFLEKGSSSLPRTGFERTSSSKTRVVYSDGSHQVSVGALPVGGDEARAWFVLMTYACS